MITGVTCPLIRIHPAILAQAAATTAAMMPGRFSLGLGTGEALNEHVVGERWPSASERLDMLEEAIAVIGELWSGEDVEHLGAHYRVVDARLYTLPWSRPRSSWPRPGLGRRRPRDAWPPDLSRPHPTPR